MFLSVAILLLKDSKLEIVNCSNHIALVLTNTVRNTQLRLPINTARYEKAGNKFHVYIKFKKYHILREGMMRRDM